MKKFEKNIYKCTGFWSWMQNNGFSQNGHFITENLNRRPEYYMVPTYHMLVGYLMDYVIAENIPMPKLSQYDAKSFYDALINAILAFEEKNYAIMLEKAVRINGTKISPQSSISRGDKVMIKSLGWYDKACQRRGSRADNFDCNGQNFTKEMSEFCGEILTVINVGSDGRVFEVSEDGASQWTWTAGMIEGVVIE